MNNLFTIRVLSLLLALLVLAFSIWQFTKSVVKVQDARRETSRLQLQTSRPSQINPGKWVLVANSHGAAGAALQARLRASARTSDVLLSRVEIQPKDNSKPSIVRANAQVSGSVQAIAKFIYQIESKAPALVIERARFNRDEEGRIDLDIVLFGRMTIESVS